MYGHKVNSFAEIIF